ncbi:hemoglobin-like flavoprotein [Palleronia aestuarii]|uniref:Hemoglobin-like flavoprotein n=1 Tax=Palleronia aestuarii TaxID=568105 RepID=A0A2W7NC66_9RHOB|nr:globin domain-containing protein [Palleronia aestuarii]PZX17570.1 hemoglobin-like flavoprotein [Palleronia aestuarii]
MPITIEETLALSFTRLLPVKRRLGQTFYDRLFEQAPSLRRLFPESMALQQEAFFSTLCAIVREAGHPEGLRPRLLALGERHAAYGAEAEHFGLVGDTLLEALRETMPGGLSAVENAAWSEAIASVSETMIEGLEAERMRSSGPVRAARP